MKEKSKQASNGKNGHINQFIPLANSLIKERSLVKAFNHSIMQELNKGHILIDNTSLKILDYNDYAKDLLFNPEIENPIGRLCFDVLCIDGDKTCPILNICNNYRKNFDKLICKKDREESKTDNEYKMDLEPILVNNDGININEKTFYIWVEKKGDKSHHRLAVNIYHIQQATTDYVLISFVDLSAIFIELENLEDEVAALQVWGMVIRNIAQHEGTEGYKLVLRDLMCYFNGSLGIFGILEIEGYDMKIIDHSAPIVGDQITEDNPLKLPEKYWKEIWDDYLNHESVKWFEKSPLKFRTSKIQPKNFLIGVFQNKQGAPLGFIIIGNLKSPPQEKRIEVFSQIIDILSRIIDLRRIRELRERQLRSYNENLQKMVEEKSGKISELAEKYKAASRAKSEFLANLSHEFRTPLNSIIGFTEIILDEMVGELNEHQKDLLRSILINAHDFLNEIEKILDFVNIEGSELSLNLQKFNLAGMVEEILVHYNHEIVRKNLRFSYMNTDFNQEIYADYEKLRKVLMNLVENAIKYTEPNKRIGIDVYHREKEIEIIVWDEGIGIPKEQHEQLFEEFTQTENPFNKLYQGLGMGLYISKYLMKQMGGKLWINQRKDGGTEVHITLPKNIGNDENYK